MEEYKDKLNVIDVNKNFSENLRWMLGWYGAKKDLTDYLNCSPHYIQKIIQRKTRRGPTINVAATIADWVGIPLEEFFIDIEEFVEKWSDHRKQLAGGQIEDFDEKEEADA